MLGFAPINEASPPIGWLLDIWGTVFIGTRFGSVVLLAFTIGRFILRGLLGSGVRSNSETSGTGKSDRNRLSAYPLTVGVDTSKKSSKSWL